MSLAIIAHLESTGHTLEQKIEKNEAVIKMCLVPLHSRLLSSNVLKIKLCFLLVLKLFWTYYISVDRLKMPFQTRHGTGTDHMAV